MVQKLLHTETLGNCSSRRRDILRSNSVTTVIESEVTELTSDTLIYLSQNK